MLAFPGVQSLDVTGPTEVFAAAVDARVEVVAPVAGVVRSSSGLGLVADRALAEVHGPVDTLVVAGGPGTRAAAGDTAVVASVRHVAARSRRVASVCTGAFVLAAAGLLDGRRATTHWRSCELLARLHPSITVEPDAIFVRDGEVWTSAGVTAGIDLALAMVEEDHGRAVAMRIARQLVVFVKRPGGQSQFSAHLAGQFSDQATVRDVHAWMVDHLDEVLTVERLAAHAAMSPRHFARVFRRDTGTTPARFVERARVDAARRALEDTDESVDAVARSCGFGTAETMRRTFLRTLRVSPREYRNRFRRVEESA